MYKKNTVNAVKLLILISLFSILFFVSNKNVSASSWLCDYTAKVCGWNATVNQFTCGLVPSDKCSCKCISTPDDPSCWFAGPFPFDDCKNTPTPNITITSPQEGSTYNSLSINTAGATTSKVKYVFYKLDLNPTPFLICSGCSSFSKNIVFLTQGNHKITIEITDYNNRKTSKSVNFKIDSLAPKINGTTPVNGKYIVGSSSETFTVVYDETDMRSAKFFWKPSEQPGYNVVPLSCASGKGVSCSTQLDLSSSPEGSQLDYYFEIQDSVSSVASQASTVKINKDMTAINIISPLNITYSSSKILLKVMTGNNVKTFMKSIDGSSFSAMCSNCDSYETYLTMFKQGQHNLTVRYVDNSGNTKEKTVFFGFDNVAPKAMLYKPINKSVTNGNFTITYTEPNLKYIKVFWKHFDDISYNEAVLSNCASGILQKTCSGIVDLSGHDGHKIAYYYELADDIYKTKTPVRTVDVDLSAPLINLVSPVAVNYSGKVYLNLTTSEKSATISRAIDSNVYTTICINCNKTTSLLFVKPGNHTVKIKATDYAGNTAYNEVTFSRG